MTPWVLSSSCCVRSRRRVRRASSLAWAAASDTFRFSASIRRCSGVAQRQLRHLEIDPRDEVPVHDVELRAV